MKRTILTGFLFLISILLFQLIAGDFKYEIDKSITTIKPKFLNPDTKKMKSASVNIRKQDQYLISFLNDLYRKVFSPKQLKELNEKRYIMIVRFYPKTGQIFYCWFICGTENKNLISESQLREISDAVLKARIKPSYLWFPEKEDKKSKTLLFSSMAFRITILPID